MKLTTKHFQALLWYAHPEAVATPLENTFDASKVDGLRIVYKPGGKVYDYKGSNYAIARELKLLPVFEVRRMRPDIGSSAYELIDKCNTESEAKEVAGKHLLQDERLAEYGEYAIFEYRVIRTQ